MVNERFSLSYSDRAGLTTNSCAKNLLELMDKKETNLALAADFWNINQLFDVIDSIGPQIAVLKTHMDLMNYQTREVASEKEIEALEIDESLRKLTSAAERYNFKIFEDRKFADIGGIVKRQYDEGTTFHIVTWAHLTNAHVFPGPDVITGLYETAKPYIDRGEERGLILLPYMTSKGNLFTPEIAQKIMDTGKNHPQFVVGWIGAGEPVGLLEHEVRETPLGTLILTPGCKLPGVASQNVQFGQVYTDPDNLISRGSDVIIVGSGIYNAKKPAKEAAIYREAGWKAYLNRKKS